MKIKFLHIVGIVTVAILIYGVIMNSDAYQQNHKKKVLGFYLSGTNKDLTLKQVITGGEPDCATFEVPVKYDLLKYPNYLRLIVDPWNEEDRSGKGGEFQECNRATNGNCLLVWGTTFDPPGQHHLRASLFCPGPRITKWLMFLGPILPFYSSNTVQFSAFYSSYNDRGAILHAKVAKTNVTYSIELTTPAGVHIRTITGSTSNGIIEEHWDLTDDHGNKYTNGSFNSDFHITLPDGTSETNATSKIQGQRSQ